MGSPTCEKMVELVDSSSNPTAFKLFGALFPVSTPSISDIPTLLQDTREGNGNPANYGNEERGLYDGANEHGCVEKVSAEGARNAIVFGKVQEIEEESISKKRRLDRAFACPRCDSTKTKFCYYNNYNVNQPRHFCKKCQRYWTAGGTLRNVPIGSGRRRNKTQNQPHNQLQNCSQGATSIDAGGASRRDMSNATFVSSGLAVSSTSLKKHLPPLAPPTHTPLSRYGVDPLHLYSYAGSHVGVSEVSELFMEDSLMCGSSLTSQQGIMKEKDVVDSELKSVDATSQGKTLPDPSIEQHQFGCGTIAWNRANGDRQTNMPHNNHVQVPMWWHPNLGWGGPTTVSKMVESDVRTLVLCKHPVEDPPFITDYFDMEPIGTTKILKIEDPVEVARSSIWTHHTSTIPSTMGKLKGFQPKPSQTKTEDPSTQSCRINPFALSRSISFHEIN